MISTRRSRQPDVLRTAPGDSFEGLGAAFRARLQGERAYFASLSTALASHDEDPMSALVDLRNRAHKIRGGAAIFELTEVAAAACTVELAAIAASMKQNHNTMTAVRAAIVALVRLMDTLNERERPASVVSSDRFRTSVNSSAT
jgi:HPt (histidine-containing phosphotransfer) domain-containing protein